MAIDSREKRASVVGINRFSGPSVTPNSGQDQEWRQEVGYSYSGILAAGGAAFQVAWARKANKVFGMGGLQ